MRPLQKLTATEARRIDTVVFDLDDTVLDHGRLSEAAFSALFRLRDAGLDLVACTGRPTAWAEIVCRQWPVDAAIAENGAVAWLREPGGRVVLLDNVDSAERSARRARLAEAAHRLLADSPEIGLADDNGGRLTDVTFDIGEHKKVAYEAVARARARAERTGLRTFASSVHLHLTFDGFDKASGFAWLARRRGKDPAIALARAAFVGDSANDAAAFAAFGLTVGVANVRGFVGRMSVPPRYVTEAAMGAGFAELAARLHLLRAEHADEGDREQRAQ